MKAISLPRHLATFLAAALLAVAASCGDDDEDWGHARGLRNGEPWEARALLSRLDTCSEWRVRVIGDLDGLTLDIVFYLPDLLPATLPLDDVRRIEGYTQLRCIMRPDTVLANVGVNLSDVQEDGYAVGPIAGAAREFVIDAVSPGRDRVTGTFSLSARLAPLTIGSPPPEPTTRKPDTLLLQDVAFEAPLR